MILQDPQSWLPVPASTFAPSVDGVWILTWWLCVFFFVLIAGLLAYAVFKWRRRTPDQPAASNTTHNTTLEVVWTVIPLIIMMVLFAWGWKGGMDMTVAPADCLQYQVKGKQWEWQIWHPGSTSPVVRDMYVPVNTNVRVTTYSEDVLHSFYIPAFRCKRDVLPGRYQMVWFNATRLSERDPETGELMPYPILCAEYCGRNHSYMLGNVYVVTQEEYDQRPWEVIPDDPVEYGQMIWERQCVACHTLDGSKLVGPTFQGLWGKTENLEDGSTVLVDREYVAESIRMPEAKRVAGYAGNNMTAYPDMTDEQVDAICAFLESLK